MRWLFRSVLFLLRSFLTLLVWIMANSLRMLLPYLLATLRLLVSLVSSSLSATVHGPRRYTQWHASKWTQRLLEAGVSREYLDQAYGLCQILVASKIVIGLVVAALFTVAILRVVYGLLI